MTTLRDTLIEAATALAARPARALLASVATTVGVAALVATIGLASTARAQIGSPFNVLTATEVRATPSDQASDLAGAIPSDAAERAARINGVTAAGRMWQVRTQSTGWSHTWSGSGQVGAGLYAVDPSSLDVIMPKMIAGRPLTPSDAAIAAPAVLLSASLARQLGVASVVPPTYVFAGHKPLLVVGIYDDVKREPQTLLGALVSVDTARAVFGTHAAISPRVIVATAAGSAQVATSQLAVALRPDDPSIINATAPPQATFLRRSIDRDVQRLLLLLALVAMAIGILSIANGMLVSVLERVPEIGLRRALGAYRRDVAAQFVLEGGLTGTIGGVLGLACGIFIVLGPRRHVPLDADP